MPFIGVAIIDIFGVVLTLVLISFGYFKMPNGKEKNAIQNPNQKTPTSDDEADSVADNMENIELHPSSNNQVGVEQN